MPVTVVGLVVPVDVEGEVVPVEGLVVPFPLVAGSDESPPHAPTRPNAVAVAQNE